MKYLPRIFIIKFIMKHGLRCNICNIFCTRTSLVKFRPLLTDIRRPGRGSELQSYKWRGWAQWGEQSVSQWVKNDVIEPRGGWAGAGLGCTGDTSPVSSSSQAAGYADREQENWAQLMLTHTQLCRRQEVGNQYLDFYLLSTSCFKQKRGSGEWII